LWVLPCRTSLVDQILNSTRYSRFLLNANPKDTL
jgi:hypothetical protein